MLQHPVRAVVVVLVLSAAVLSSCSTVKTSTQAVLPLLQGTNYDPPGSTQTADKPIFLQTKTTYEARTELGSVYASNEFDGARLSDFQHTSDSTFTARILPENTPINASAWYAFKLWSQVRRTITLRLHYPTGKHRYVPKISRDGKTWKHAATPEYAESGTEATLRLELSPDTLWVAAQELLTSRDMERWADSLVLAKNTAALITKRVFGKSTMGRPLYALNVSEAQAGTEQGYVVLLCRQHPPEVPGNQAFLTFVETLLANTELAKRFRQTMRTIIVPCVNPDGVDMGHWRHNAHGVDLNRDWQFFNQPETRQVSAELLRWKAEAERRGKHVMFGIDFHSTQEDVFYIIPGDTTYHEITSPEAERYKASYKRIKAWLSKIQAAVPHYRLNADESPDNLQTPSSNRWMNRELFAATTTYEVGDETNRSLVREVARAAANAMMELCLQEAR